MRRAFYVLLFLVLLGGGWYAYGEHKIRERGYYGIPPVTARELPMVFGGDVRAIIPVGKELGEIIGGLPPKIRWTQVRHWDRRYWANVWETKPWFEKMWIRCSRPDEEEVAYLTDPEADDWRAEWRGARPEALCYVEADNEKMLRAVIYSAPRSTP